MDESFFCVIAPGWLDHFIYNEHYKNDEEYIFALAEALREEYLAVVNAGFILQIDDPGLPDWWDMIKPALSVEDYSASSPSCASRRSTTRSRASRRTACAITCAGAAGTGRTPTICRSSTSSSLMLQVKAQCYSFEAANVRHEHEWRLWKDTKLPDGKMILPGVVSHATNLIEHPELIAERIMRFANAVGRENVIAGTDCGLGGRVHAEIAWAKLGALAEGAKLASKRLW